MTLAQGPEPAPDDASRVLRVGALEIDRDGLCISVGGVRMALPRREFEVLLVLAENAGRVLPARLLLDRVWGPGFVDGSGTLKVHVNRIRRRITGVLGVDYIRTVRGLGYSLDPDLARGRSASRQHQR
ncbi:MAG TPA: winged helix-turn-helix domain-containing protein [Mycobacteriales bacterium]|nr:winged helix-turn-helix domain-containing protein [Mycobacteriales bacterium]